MSSCLCKKLEGAVLPFQVEPLGDGVDDAIYAFNVHKAEHGAGAATHLDETLRLRPGQADPVSE